MPTTHKSGNIDRINKGSSQVEVSNRFDRDVSRGRLGRAYIAVIDKRRLKPARSLALPVRQIGHLSGL